MHGNNHWHSWPGLHLAEANARTLTAFAGASISPRRLSPSRCEAAQIANNQNPDAEAIARIRIEAEDSEKLRIRRVCQPAQSRRKASEP